MALGQLYVPDSGGGVTSWKQAVRAATTAAGTLASSFENGDAIDGVTLATGDRILIKNQATASENGIYVVNASGAPTRATDADSGAELVNATIYVSEGTTLADTQWTCTTNAPITLGATSLAFAQMGSGSGGTIAVQEEGSTVTAAAATLNVVGAGATVSDVAGVATITIPSNGTTPDTIPATQNVADDEWDGGALDTAGTRRSGATAWAWDNQGSAAATLTRGRLVLSCIGDSSGTHKTHNILQALPAGDWTYECEYRLLGLTGSFSAGGVMLRESGTNKRLALVKGIDAGTKIQVRRYTSATVWTANPYTSTTDEALTWQTFYASIQRASATITISLGDGAAYRSRYSFTQTTEFTTAPNEIGLSVGPSNAETVVLTCGWFRRTA